MEKSGRIVIGVMTAMVLVLPPARVTGTTQPGANPDTEKAVGSATPYVFDNLDFSKNILRNSGFERTTKGGYPIPEWTVQSLNWIPMTLTPGNSALAVTSEQKVEGRNALRMNIQRGRSSFAIYQEIPAAQTPRYYLLSLFYKSTVSIPMTLGFANRMPEGFGAPKVKFITTPSREWQQALFPLQMVNRAEQKRYFEIVIECSLEDDAQVFFDEIKLAPLARKAKIRMSSPQSGIVFDRLDTGKLCFISTYPVRMAPNNLKVSLVSRGNARRGNLNPQRLPLVQEDKFTFEATLPAHLPLGEYLVKLADTDQGLEAQFELRKLPLEHPSLVIHGGVPYLNGKPFLTLGIFQASDMPLAMVNEGQIYADKGLVSPGNKETGLPLLTMDAMLSSLAAKGFNNVMWTHGVPPEDFFKSTEKWGLTVLPPVSCNPESQPVRHFRNLLFWMALDELGGSREVLEKEYALSRRLDPYHCIFGSTSSSRFAGSAGAFEDWACFDIIAPDVYDIGGPESDVDTTYAALRDAAKYFVKGDPRKCVFLIPQLFCAYGPCVPSNAETYGWSNGFEPEYRQIRAQVYTGVVAGAKGFIYYSYVATESLTQGMSGNPRRKHWFLPESKLWERIGELNHELLSLQDPILGGQGDGSVVFAGGKIRTAVRKTPGATFIFAVNPWPTAESTSFARKSTNRTFTPLFDSAPFPNTKKGYLGMGPFEVGIWKIDP